MAGGVPGKRHRTVRRVGLPPGIRFDVPGQSAPVMGRRPCVRGMDAQEGLWGRLEEKGMIEGKYRESIPLPARFVPITGHNGGTIVDIADKTNKR